MARITTKLRNAFVAAACVAGSAASSAQSQAAWPTDPLNPRLSSDSYLRYYADRSAMAYDYANTVMPNAGGRSDPTRYPLVPWSQHAQALAAQGWIYKPFYGSNGDGGDAPGLVLYNPARGEMEIVFHGTRSGRIFLGNGDWAPNMPRGSVNMNFAHDPYGYETSQLRVSRGFAEKYSSLAPSMHQAMDEAVAQAHPGYAPEAVKPYLNYTITGHSQGAAMSQLALYDVGSRVQRARAMQGLPPQANQVSGVLISPPKVFADEDSRRQVEGVVGRGSILSVYDDSDLVPRVGFSPHTSFLASRRDLIPGMHRVVGVGEFNSPSRAHFAERLTDDSFVSLSDRSQFVPDLVPTGGYGGSGVAGPRGHDRGSIRAAIREALSELDVF